MQDMLNQNLLGEYYIIADQGYHLQANLLTPYPCSGPLTKEQVYYNECLSKTRVKVECVIGMMKKKIPVLSVKSHYQPDAVCNVIKAVSFLWNFGLLSSDNKGYDPDMFVVTGKDELNSDLKATVAGDFRREIVTKYLWNNK